VARIAGLLLHLHGAAHVALDEGGLRCTADDGAAYVPFASIADVDIETRLFGRVELVLTGVEHDTLRIPLTNANPLDVQRACLLRRAERRAASVIDVPSVLVRGTAPFTEWLARVVGTTGERGGYRDGAVDAATLVAVLGDEHADAAARAAAAHALVASGSAEHLLAVARVFVAHALPPIVLVAAHLAPGGAALVSKDVASELLPFLAVEDARTCVQVADADRERLVAHALSVALDEARAAAEASSDADDHSPRRRRLAAPTAGVGAAGWIGRTWAL
jgi:hypothetical protein